MARGAARAQSEFPLTASERGFAAQEGGGMPSVGSIQGQYNPTSQLFANYTGKEHRDFARSVLRDAFATSKWSELSMPDSQYAMDALDTMQRMAERWTAAGKEPTTAEVKEFREIAKRAVESMNDELDQEARALRADFAREFGGSRAQSEGGGGGVPNYKVQPDGSASKFPKTRALLDSFDTQNAEATRELATRRINGFMPYGVDIRDLPDSMKIVDAVNSVAERAIKLAKKTGSGVTDAEIIAFNKSTKRLASGIYRAALRDGL